MMSRRKSKIKFTVNGINPKDLKLVLDGEAAKKEKGVPPAKIQFVDCQSAQQNVGKEFRGALHMDLFSADFAQLKFDSIVEKVPTTFNKLAAADMVVFYCSFAQIRSPATMHAYQKSMTAKPRANSNPNQHVVLLDDGIDGYMKLKDAHGIKDCTVPSMGKVLAWAKLDNLGAKIEVTKPSFQQPPKPGTVQESLALVYTE